MSANKLWIIVLALASIVVVALGWVLGVKPQLDATIAADQQRDAVIAENAEHAADLATLKQQFADIAALRSELTKLRTAVPSAFDSAGVVGDINAIASELGVAVVTIAWGDAVFYAPATSAGVIAPAPAATSDDAADDADADPAATTPPPATVPTADPSAGVVAVDPADSQALTSAQLVAIPVTVTVNADYSQLLRFVTRLGEGKRLFLVTGASLAQGTEAGAGASTISGLVYVLPGPAGAITGSVDDSDTQTATTSG